MRERGIADLLRALTVTQPRDWPIVAAVLGFASVPEQPPVSIPGDEIHTPTVPIDGDGPAMPPPTRLGVWRAEEDLPRRLSVPTGEGPPTDIPWLDVPTLTRPGGSGPAPPALQPLLQPRRRAAVLAALCDTRRPTGRVDVAALVPLMARRSHVRRLPRLPRTTLARGVQVLVDGGEGLQPFAADAPDVLEGLRALLGHDLVQDGWFADDPRHGVAFDDLPGPYQPPAPGTPVLLLTDLGIGGGGSRHRWPRKDSLVELARRLTAQQSSVVALVPYPPSRWPSGLDRRIALVFWDRRATVAEVRRARRRTGEAR